jgi:hypothetical protein
LLQFCEVAQQVAEAEDDRKKEVATVPVAPAPAAETEKKKGSEPVPGAKKEETTEPQAPAAASQTAEGVSRHWLLSTAWGVAFSLCWERTPSSLAVIKEFKSKLVFAGCFKQPCVGVGMWAVLDYSADRLAN